MLALRVGWPTAAPQGGWTRQHLVTLRRRLHLMASIRKADLARRHGQCGSSRFWQPYRGGSQHALTARNSSMAVQPGRHDCTTIGGTIAATPGATCCPRIPPPPCQFAARSPRRGCTGQRLGGIAAGNHTRCCGTLAASPETKTTPSCKRPLDDNYDFADEPAGALPLCTRS
eukprot:9960184-Alexandrium_andersonii.AAC.1